MTAPVYPTVGAALAAAELSTEPLPAPALVGWSGGLRLYLLHRAAAGLAARFVRQLAPQELPR